MQAIYNFFFPPKMPLSAEKKQQIDQSIKNDHIFIASKTYCPYCHRAKDIILKKHGAKATVVELDDVTDGSSIQDYLHEVTGQRTVPNIFIDGKHIGGCSDIEALESKGELNSLL